MIPESETYQQQLARHVRERDEQIRAAETELGQRRTQVDQLTSRAQSAEAALAATLEAVAASMRSETYAHRAWQSTIVQARRQATRAEQAEARIAAIRAECERPVASVHGSHNEGDATRDVCSHPEPFVDRASGDLRCRSCTATLATYTEDGGYPDQSWTVACPEDRCRARQYTACVRPEGSARARSCGSRWARFDREARP